MRLFNSTSKLRLRFDCFALWSITRRDLYKDCLIQATNISSEWCWQTMSMESRNRRTRSCLRHALKCQEALIWLCMFLRQFLLLWCFSFPLFQGNGYAFCFYLFEPYCLKKTDCSTLLCSVVASLCGTSASSYSAEADLVRDTGASRHRNHRTESCFIVTDVH